VFKSQFEHFWRFDLNT